MKIQFSVFVLLLLLSVDLAFAQSPQSINYQAVARDGESGGELINQPVDVVFSILDDGPNGSVVYQEIQSTETNAFGLVNLQIGEGEAIEGTLDQVDWGADEKWLVVDMDLGEGLEEVSSSRFVSVPYALHAEMAGSVENVDDADADPTNELIDTLLLNGTVLEAYEGGFPEGNLNAVDLSALVDDADADPTNELIDSLVLSGNVLEIYEGGSSTQAFSIDLASLINDDDADPTNELIEEGSFQLIDTMLVFTEGGITQEVNLATLANYGPWQVGEGTVFNTDSRIGIGTDEPEHKLEVVNISDVPADSVAIFASGESESTRNYGVYARASGASENRAIYGDAPGNSDFDWAGYFDGGNVFVSNKLAVGAEEGDAQLNITSEEESTPIVHTETVSGDPALHVEGSGQVGVREENPHSDLHVNGSVAGKVRYEDAGVLDLIELTPDDYMLIADVTSGAVTVHLPSAEGCEGRIYYIKRFHSTLTANILTITSDLGDTIDGSLSPVVLSGFSVNESRMFVSAGSNGWFIMSE